MSLFSKKSKNNNDKVLYPWSQKKLGGSNSALPRSGHCAVMIQPDILLLYGGYHRSSTKKDLFYVDINGLSASSVSTTGDVPSHRAHAIIVPISNYILLFGGRPLLLEENYDSSVYLLNLNSRRWTRMRVEETQPMERSGHTAITQDGMVYIWGGQIEGKYFNDLFMLNTSTLNSNARWEQIAYNNEGPEPRSGHISALYENTMYIFGGSNGQTLFNDIWSYDLHTGLWTRLEINGYIPQPRESCASSMVGDIIYIVGGRGENGVELNDLSAFKISRNCWYRFQKMGPSPSPRHALTMTAADERLFVIGGDNDTSRMDDQSCIFILDSSKVKYPEDNPQLQQQQQQQQQMQQQQMQQQQMQQQQMQQQQSPSQSPYQGQQYQAQQLYQQQHDTVSIDEANDSSVSPSPQSHPQYQQQQQSDQQYQPTLDHTYSQQQLELQYQQQYQIQQQYQQQFQQQPAAPEQYSQYSQQPTRQTTQKQYADPSRQRANPPTSPQQNHKSMIAKNTRDMENYADNQNSPTTTPRHRSYYPEGPAQQSSPPTRPPRHMSTVPEAVLRRPRTTSPNPPSESDVASEIRRQLQSNGTPTSPTGGDGDYLSRGSPMQIAMSPEDSGFMEPSRSSPSQQRLTQISQQNSSRSSPGATAPLTPPPRPPRDGVGLNNQQRNTMAIQANEVNPIADHGREEMRPKSHIPKHQQQYAEAPHYFADQLPERYPSRQILPTTSVGPTSSSASTPIPTHSSARATPVPDTAAMNAAVSAAAGAAATAATAAANAAAAEEQQNLLREINARDVIISEMKKKESWWRTEVSIARKLRAAKGETFDDGPDADEAMLMDIDSLEEDKVKLFEQLVSVKSELRRVRVSILQQAQPMSEKVNQADRMRTAALQEAAYFKSKYLALKSRRQEEYQDIELSRCDILEKRLANALTENETNSRLLQQLQKRAQHDQNARVATEERANEAQNRAEEAQQAHQRALEELQALYSRAAKAENQVRENALKIADLTQQLSEALTVEPLSMTQEVTEAQLRASQLEAANLKARNEAAVLKQRLSESKDEIAVLRNMLNEREDALNQANINAEDYQIQLTMMKEAMIEQHHKNNLGTGTNDYNSTKAY
ncbi:hypothetical protein BDB01DRAFT_738618 [Pilobolus umbonatus]|nr:hypothetical protein BDB01DRAFT_738618 [Pilobolus umbonatus]